MTAASSSDGVTFGPTQPVTTSGVDLTVANGQYLKVSVSFLRASTGASPILYDLTVRPKTNDPPTVDLLPAGPLNEGAPPLTLTATASDPNGDPLTYSWSLLSGTGVLTPAGATATYSNDDGPATATIQVTVSDGQGGTATDTETVETLNLPPA